MTATLDQSLIDSFLADVVYTGPLEKGDAGRERFKILAQLRLGDVLGKEVAESFQIVASTTDEQSGYKVGVGGFQGPVFRDT
jgi:hypothetical protein